MAKVVKTSYTGRGGKYKRSTVKNTATLSGRQKLKLAKIDADAKLGKYKGATTRSLAKTGAMATAVESAGDSAARIAEANAQQASVLDDIYKLVDPTDDAGSVDNDTGSGSAGKKPSTTIGG